jgi:hypothetical protein
MQHSECATTVIALIITENNIQIIKSIRIGTFCNPEIDRVPFTFPLSVVTLKSILKAPTKNKSKRIVTIFLVNNKLFQWRFAFSRFQASRHYLFFILFILKYV